MIFINCKKNLIIKKKREEWIDKGRRVSEWRREGRKFLLKYIYCRYFGEYFLRMFLVFYYVNKYLFFCYL